MTPSGATRNLCVTDAVTSTPALSFSLGLTPASSDRPGDDPIFALNAQANAHKATGKRTLNATLGALHEDDGQLAVMQSVFDALQQVPPQRAAAYAPIAGSPVFLQRVIEDLFGDGPLASQAVAVATPGGTGALYDAIVNYLEPGQKLLTSSFYWSPYAILAEHARRGVATFEMFNAEGGFDLGAFAQGLDELLAAQGRALVILNTPCHNPTGYSLDDEEWRGIVDVLQERAKSGKPIALVIDYAYAKFAGSICDWRPYVERLTGTVDVLIAWTASKSFALYGGRVGALVGLHPDKSARERLFNALQYTCRGTWSNGNHLGMLAIEHLLSDPELRARSEQERARMVQLLASRVEQFNQLAAPAGLEYPRYEGGFFVSIFTPEAKQVVRRCMDRGVFLVPLQGAVRVALCATPASDVPFLTETLSEALRG